MDLGLLQTLSLAPSLIWGKEPKALSLARSRKEIGSRELRIGRGINSLIDLCINGRVGPSWKK